MRILFAVPYAPNLIRTRPYNLVRQLAAAGHKVTLLTLFTDSDEAAGVDALRQEGVDVVAFRLTRRRSLMNSLFAVPTTEPLQAAYCWHPAAGEALRGLLDAGPAGGEDGFDVVHVEHLRGARYALLAQALLGKQGATVPVVWDSVDCISDLFRAAAQKSRSFFGRWITRAELHRTEQFEGRLTGEFARVLATSAGDKQALLRLARQQQKPISEEAVTVLPNGVDLEYFGAPAGIQREPAALVVSGKMSYHANVSMVRFLVDEVMPLVWREAPHVRLEIVGKDPAPEVQAVATHRRVLVTGTVPDVRPYLQRAAVAVAPVVYGAGIQNKVLEAMASGTPTVTTGQALRALEAVPGRDLLVGDDAAALARQILLLLTDESLRRRLGKAGRAYVTRHHNWQAIAGRLVEIYCQAIAVNQSSESSFL